MLRLLDTSSRVMRRLGAQAGARILVVLTLASLPCGVRAQGGQPEWESEEEVSSEEASPEEASPEAPERSEQRPRKVVGISPTEAQLRGADADLERMDQALAEVQGETRAYLGSWVVGMTALMSFNLYTAMSAESEARRGAFTVASALSGANFFYLLIQGWPALGSLERFRSMPSSTVQEKVAKATYAHDVIVAQRHKDHLVATIERHIGAFVVGIGAGLGVGLGYQDLYEGLGLGVGVIGVAELLILTRPGNYHSPEKRPTFSLRNLHVSPWADQYARGIGVAGRF